MRADLAIRKVHKMIGQIGRQGRIVTTVYGAMARTNAMETETAYMITSIMTVATAQIYAIVQYALRKIIVTKIAKRFVLPTLNTSAQVKVATPISKVELLLNAAPDHHQAVMGKSLKANG
jgi:hypothetical protein